MQCYGCLLILHIGTQLELKILIFVCREIRTLGPANFRKYRGLWEMSCMHSGFPKSYFGIFLRTPPGLLTTLPKYLYSYTSVVLY